MKFLSAIVLGSLLVLVECPATGATIVSYDSTNPNGANGDPSPDIPASGDSQSDIEPLDLSRGAGLIAAQGIAFNSRAWRSEDTLDLNSTDFIRWGWSAGTGVYDLEEMYIQYDVSPSGPNQIAITGSFDNAAAVLLFEDFDTNPSDESATIDLSSFDGIGSAEFRLFGYDTANVNGTLDIEELVDTGGNAPEIPGRGIVVIGTAISSVPEPQSIAVFAVTFSLIFCDRRRKRSTDLIPATH